MEGAMLGNLRQRAEMILAHSQRATLSTCGPADIQADEVPVVAQGVLLYVQLPSSSDHLYNLESSGAVVVSTPAYHLRGVGRVLPPDETPPGSAEQLADSPWRVLVEIRPLRLQILDPSGAWVETLDMDAPAHDASAG
jgi:hypothetical protein